MTTRTIRLGAAASALALALLPEASTDTDTGSTEAEGSGAGADLDLVADDQLTVCSDVPYAPFEMEDESTDSGYTGFDIELLEAIAADLGLTVTVKDLPFDGILGALPAGDCDIVGSAVSITPEREEQVLFSESYFDSKQSLMVLAENEEAYPDLESLAGKTIGVQTGTTGATYAEENKPEGAPVKEYEGGEDLFGALTAGEIDAALQDFPVNAYQAAQDDAFVVVASFGEGEPYGFAMEKDDTALADAVNASLAGLRDDGTYDEIYATYFGEAEG